MKQHQLITDLVKVHDSLSPLSSDQEAIQNVIANGFIVLKWVDLKNQSPESGIAKLVCLQSGFITVGYLRTDKELRTWQLFGDVTPLTHSLDQVTYWMDLPTNPYSEVYRKHKVVKA